LLLLTCIDIVSQTRSCPDFIPMLPYISLNWYLHRHRLRLDIYYKWKYLCLWSMNSMPMALYNMYLYHNKLFHHPERCVSDCTVAGQSVHWHRKIISCWTEPYFTSHKRTQKSIKWPIRITPITATHHTMSQTGYIL
jgi:hypothetical protein